MGFKRLWQAMGVGGPSVETTLEETTGHPGGSLSGQVRVAGGGEDPIDVEYLSVGLMTRLDIDNGHVEYNAGQEFHRQRLTGSFRLDPGARHTVDFRFA